jgi:pimeloyl-ACP methyl ester carboxylesterase
LSIWRQGKARSHQSQHLSLSTLNNPLITFRFAGYTEGMQKVQAAQVKSKSDADEILKAYEPSLPTRQFLLTNSLTQPATEQSPAHLRFRIPLETLSEAIPSIGEFPFSPPELQGEDIHPKTLTMAGERASSPQASWPGPTLFLKGSKSKYINKYNIPVARAFFPSMRVVELDAGHWVHAERPKETVELVREFVTSI